VACLVTIQSAGFHQHFGVYRLERFTLISSTPIHPGLQGSSGELRLESLGCHVKSQAGVWESN
jgi:hypothetical protein